MNREVGNAGGMGLDVASRPEPGSRVRRRRSGGQPPAPYGSRVRSLAELFVPAFFASVLLSVGAEFFPSAIWAFGALLGFIIFSVGLIKKSPATFMLFCPLIADRVTEFVSGAAIESGAYMVETDTSGTATGAFSHLLVIYILFYGLAAGVTEAMWPSLRRYLLRAPEIWEVNAKRVSFGLYVVLSIFTVYMLRLGLNNGFPLLSSVDRFVYLNKLDSPYYTFILHNRLLAIPFIGMLLTIPKYRWRGIWMIALIVVFSVLFAEKFGSLLLILTVAFIPYGLLHVARGRTINLGVVGGVAAAVIIVTVPAVLLVYGAAKDPQHAVEAYGTRAALQGQLWWHADRKYLSVFAYDGNALGADVKSWLDPTADSRDNVTSKYGLYYVMERFAPAAVVGRTMEGGTGFVFSLYPYLLMTSGLFGLIIISSTLAVFHAVIMGYLAESMARGNWIALLAFARIFSNMMSCFTSGYLYSAYGFKTIGLFVIGIMLLKVYTPSIIFQYFSAKRKIYITRRTARRGAR